MRKNNGPEHESDNGIKKGILGGDRFSDIDPHNWWGRVSEIFLDLYRLICMIIFIGRPEHEKAT